jgi:hypothetical protein
LPDRTGHSITRNGITIEVQHLNGESLSRGAISRTLSCTPTTTRSVFIESNLPEGFKPGDEVMAEYRIEQGVFYWRNIGPDGSRSAEYKAELVR